MKIVQYKYFQTIVKKIIFQFIQLHIKNVLTKNGGIWSNYNRIVLASRAIGNNFI